eukprot:COSAG06_NODE_7783_length_2378_cov_1.742870_1_plen_57_part_10
MLLATDGATHTHALLVDIAFAIHSFARRAILCLGRPRPRPGPPPFSPSSGRKARTTA